MERASSELRSVGPAAPRTGAGPFKDFVHGQPAPRTLYTVLDAETGIENEVTDQPPERGHVLVVAGEQVLGHHLDRMGNSGQLTAEEQSRLQAAQAPGAAISAKAEEGQAAGEAKPTAEAEEDSATPAAIEAAEKAGVDVGQIKGTGKDGKVTKADVEKAAAEADARKAPKQP